MMNLSLARIMYGTNEDYRASTSISAAALPSLNPHSRGRGFAERESSATTNAFSAFLHKAWAALHHKG